MTPTTRTRVASPRASTRTSTCSAAMARDTTRDDRHARPRVAPLGSVRPGDHGACDEGTSDLDAGGAGGAVGAAAGGRLGRAARGRLAPLRHGIVFALFTLAAIGAACAAGGGPRGGAAGPAPVAALGLTSAEAGRRLEAAPPPPARSGSRSYRDIVVSNTFTVFNAILGTLFVLVLAFGDPRDALFGGVILARTPAIGIVQEVRAKRVLDRLSLLAAAPEAHAWRDGRSPSWRWRGWCRRRPAPRAGRPGRRRRARRRGPRPLIDESILTGRATRSRRRWATRCCRAPTARRARATSRSSASGPTASPSASPRRPAARAPSSARCSRTSTAS